MSIPASREIQSFIDYLRFEKRYSPHTIVSYENDLTDFFNYLDAQFGKLALKDITHNFIRSWLAHLKETDLASKSINRKISSLRSFFKFMLKTSVIDIYAYE